MKKSKSCQKKFRKEVFSFYQYWIIYFTEKVKISEGKFVEKDFVTFIKAKSYDLSKIILTQKATEDFINESSNFSDQISVSERKKLKSKIKIKSIRPYMLHKNYKNTKLNRSFSLEDWDHVKKSAFPNLKNFLFKKELPRPEGFTNKFNQTDYRRLKNIGFKSGEENWSRKNRKGIYLPVDERKGMIYKGKWVKWDKEEMKKTKNQIIEAFALNNNNRKKSAEYLNLGRSSLYKLMVRIESLDWWNENYPYTRLPPPKIPTEIRSELQKKAMKKRMANGEVPFSSLSKDQKKACVKNRVKALKKSSLKYRKSLVPVIIEALKNNSNVRSKAAESLNVKDQTFRKWLRLTKDLVNWKKEYPSPFSK